MTSSRRSFLRAAACAGGALALPACSSGPAPRAPKRAGEKLRLGVVGVGGRGGANLSGVRGEEIVALCDVDRLRLVEAQREFRAASVFVDFRELLELPGLDGVVVSTPDHTHYPAAMMALQRGLDVYCEKPLTHTVHQARRLAATAARNGCVTQMGTQIHANSNYRRVVEAIRAGVIGAVERVHVFVGGVHWDAVGLPEAQQPPEHLAWSLWLGPSPERPFSPAYHPAGWRSYWAFGGGTTADMACHHMDLPFWALDLDAPVALRADGPEPLDGEGAPRSLACEYEFAARGDRGPVQVRWACGDLLPQDELEERGLSAWRAGTLFVGTDGWLISNYDTHEVGPASKVAGYSPPPQTIAPSPGHHQEWIRCCKDRTLPSCHFGYAGPLTETVLLANVGRRAARGVRLRWDAGAGRLSADPGAGTPAGGAADVRRLVADANALLDERLGAGFDV